MTDTARMLKLKRLKAIALQAQDAESQSKTNLANGQGSTAQSAIDVSPNFNLQSLPAGANPENDKWTGGRDELGNKIYQTVGGAKYVMDIQAQGGVAGQKDGQSKWDAMSQNGILPGIGNAAMYEAGNFANLAKSGITAFSNPSPTVGDAMAASMFVMPSSLGLPKTAAPLAADAVKVAGAGVAKIAPAAPLAADAELQSLIKTAVSGGRAAGPAQERLAAMAKADPAVAAAAKKLGVSLPADMNVSHAQLAEQFRLFRSQPGSAAEAAYKAAKQDVAAQADAAMANLGGVSDVAQLSAKVKSDLDASQAALKAKASALYDEVGKAIGPQQKVIPQALADLLTQTKKDLGGVAGMTAEEKRLLSMISPGDMAKPAVKPINYALIDRTRQDIGAALRGKASPYGNVSEGTLKRLYGALSDDQMAAAKTAGVGPTLEAAQKLTTQKKAMEKGIITAFGRDLNGSIATQLRSAVSSGARGDIGGLNRILEIIPEKLRREALATGIADAVRSRSAVAISEGENVMRAFSADNFVKFYSGIRGNGPVFATIVKTLGPGSAEVLDAINKVSRRVVDSAPIMTGKALGKLSYLSTDGLIQSILQSSVTGAVRRTGAIVGGAVVGGPIGAAVAAGFDEFLTRTKPDMRAAASKLFVSDEFKALVEKVAGSVPIKSSSTQSNAAAYISGQIKMVAQSPAFKAWAKLTGIQDGQKWLIATIAASRASAQSRENK